MKVLITGSTGLVGSALVRQALADDRITHVYTLTRKPLSDEITKNPKATVILHEDFGTWGPELMGKLEGVEGCLWYVHGL